MSIISLGLNLIFMYIIYFASFFLNYGQFVYFLYFLSISLGYVSLALPVQSTVCETTCYVPRTTLKSDLSRCNHCTH